MRNRVELAEIAGRAHHSLLGARIHFVFLIMLQLRAGNDLSRSGNQLYYNSKIVYNNPYSFRDCSR